MEYKSNTDYKFETVQERTKRHNETYKQRLKERQCVFLRMVVPADLKDELLSYRNWLLEKKQ